tara:strand:+ start:337 stop:2295 length:1959 start_codon:yes stop_codon:yes gene_type:complete
MPKKKRNLGKNPYNDENSLFKSLTRLFSGPITNRRTQTGRQLRRRHLDIYANRFKSASGKQFKKVEYNPMTVLAANMISNRNRSERYVDFDQMEYTPEIASSLDIYADEMTTHSSLQRMLRISCPNEEIKSILDNLYHNVLNIEHNLFGWCRTMCKYGDLFLYLDIEENMGIKACIGLPAQEIERLEGEDESNPNYVQYQWNSAGMTLENWQMAHFRILGNDKHAPYGTSVLEPARRIWRQLTLLEDAMMAYRIVRSPERRVFKIDVGNIPPQDVEQYMQKVMTQMKRHQVVDPKTGRLDLRYNPLSIEEDYYIPVRGTSQTEITSLAGGQFTGTVEDVKYLRDKLFSALKIPQSYLTMGEGATEDKTTLAQKDIRFARTIQRLQRVVIAELEKIGIVHLFTMGFRNDDLLSFSLKLNNPSKIAELQELEQWDKKFSVAGNATEGYFSRRWIAEKVFGLSEEEFLRMQREMFHDRKFSASLEAAGQVPEAGGAGGGLGDLGGGGEELGDLGGGEELGGLGGEDAPADEPADEGGGDDEILLAEPPAKRDDEKKKEDKPKYKRGRYKRHKTSYSKGGLSKQLKRTHTPEFGDTNRTIFPGKSGFGGLDSLARGITENIDINKIEEEKLFSTSRQVDTLIESLLKTKVTDDEAQ